MSHRGEGREDARWSMAARSAAGEEVAHLRARFGVDPATPATLATAWQAPTGATEEDESEFVDAVADCLSVGLPMEAAVTSWREGSLETERESDDDEETTVFEEETTDVYDPTSPTSPTNRPGGRRVLVR
ncbi:MAG TPA: hypothetical protein VHJ20_04070 [Polyangia bacterium]|nr:hypothetical protein [Polyangia bacterium]